MVEDPSSSILRGVRVLVGLAEMGKPVSFGTLAEALGLPPSSTHRILSALRQAGYVRQDPNTGSYSPGTSFLCAATAFCVSTTYPRMMREALDTLVEQSGESAYYGAYLAQSQRFRFVASRYSEHAVQYVSRADKTYSLLWGASGRVIAAFLPDRALKAIYDREKDSGEGNVPLPPWKTFRQEMEAVRTNGYCSTSNSRFDGAHSISAPVFGFDDRVIGCLGISMPSQRRDPGRIDGFAKLVIAAARQLSTIAQCAVEQSFPEVRILE